MDFTKKKNNYLTLILMFVIYGIGVESSMFVKLSVLKREIHEGCTYSKTIEVHRTILVIDFFKYFKNQKNIELPQNRFDRTQSVSRKQSRGRPKFVQVHRFRTKYDKIIAVSRGNFHFLVRPVSTVDVCFIKTHPVDRLEK